MLYCCKFKYPIIISSTKKSFMKRIAGLLLIALFTLCFTAINAQEKSSHYKAAEQMLLNMRADKVADDVMNNMFQMQAKANPMLEKNKENITGFLKKYMSWEAMREDMINVYMSEFSESELNDISAFYLTPAGKKMAEKQPNIMKKMMQVSQEKIQSHMGEIMNMMQKQQQQQ